MGYYTEFELRMTHHPEGQQLDISEDDFERIKQDLETITNGFKFYIYTSPHVMVLSDAKWYDHAEDMKALSKRWPKILFQLDGKGEESGDIWREYWIVGKVQAEKQGEWKPPVFDPKKLV